MIAASNDRVQRRLQIVRWFALLDTILPIALVTAAVTGQRNVVHVLGPVHGINFLLLVVFAGTAAIDGLWGWWFPALILVTAGPIVALFGERMIGRRLATATAPTGESL